MQGMIPGLHTALVLYMVLTSTTCRAKRSLSMQHRLLSYLRSTQAPERMSNIALIHCNRDVAKTLLQLPVLMREFVSINQVQRIMFLDSDQENEI